MLNEKNLYKALATVRSRKENGVKHAEYKKKRLHKKNFRKLEFCPTVSKEGT